MIEKVTPQNSNSPDDDPLICRPSRLWWGMIGFWCLLGTFASGPIYRDMRSHSRDPWWGDALILVGLFAVPVLWGIWAVLRYRIEADAQGLTFVGLLKRRFIPWNSITDIWLDFPQGKETQQRNYIEVNGKKQLLTKDMRDIEALKSRIEREAKWAKSRRFQLRVTRDDGEWPKTFVYKDTPTWKTALLVGFGFSVVPLQFGLKMSSGAVANMSMMWSFFSLWEKIAFVLFTTVMCCFYPLIFLLPYPGIVTKRKWLHKSVVAERDALTFRDQESERTIRFEEITSYSLEALPGHLQPNLCVVETKRERFEFLTSIEQGKVLCALIRERAQQAKTRDWHVASGQDNDILGGSESLWRGANVGIGAKSYHYRTRTNRAMIFFGLVFMVLPLTPFFAHWFLGLPKNGDWGFLAFCWLIMGMPTFYGVCGWFFSALETDESGLRQRSIWGQRFMKWDEIESYGYNGFCYFIRGGKRAIHFGMVADFGGLQTEIEQHAPQAKKVRP